MRIEREPLEAEEQKALFEWAGYMGGKHPELRFMYHVPNGGRRNAREAAMLKAEGVKAGVPDIVLPAARGRISWALHRAEEAEEREPEQRAAGIS